MDREKCLQTVPSAETSFLNGVCNFPKGASLPWRQVPVPITFGRRLTNFGLQVKIIAAQFVAPYRVQGKTGKNDANDAAAICEAASRPHIHDVPVKSAQQQAVMSLHKIREGYKEERTACINRIRGLLYEFGVIRSRAPRNLRCCLADIIEDASNELPTLVRLVIQRAYQHWVELEEHLAWCDDQIIAHHKSDEQVRRAAELIGVGTITASAVVASVGDFRQFKSGSQFGAWLGLTPKQNSSGGKACLGAITKRGNSYLRNLMVVGAKAAVFTCDKRSDPTSVWVRKLRDRIGWQKATVALANKNARILWSTLALGRKFDRAYVSPNPFSKAVAQS
jgi:transposase